MHVHSTDSVRASVMVRVCEYAYNRVWGLRICVKSTAYAKKRKNIRDRMFLILYVYVCACKSLYIRF